MRNVLDKSFPENKKKTFYVQKDFLFSENVTFCEIM